MRIARVLQEWSPSPIAALERDGALYKVGELDEAFGTARAEDVLAGSSDFHARVVAVGCAGLGELDDRLLSGRRPSRARLLPGTFVWLAPCDTERATLVHVDAAAHSPRVWLGPARALAGHGASLPCPPRAAAAGLEVTLELAALLGEDLRCASVEDAERAVLGYSLLASVGPRDAVRGPDGALDFPAQLGNVLVTRDEASDVLGARIATRVGDRELDAPAPPARIGVAEAIAHASHRLDLRAGDVVGTRAIARFSAELGVAFTFAVERLGVLSGRPTSGWDPDRWRDLRG